MTNEYFAAIEVRIAKGGAYMPRWGWHDDHRAADGTPAYLPALMQVRSEYERLVEVLAVSGVVGGRALQLGLGECNASHDVLRILFQHVTTISWGKSLRDDDEHAPGNTHDGAMIAFARSGAPYDFLLIDAGHGFNDVRLDHSHYGQMVRPGGIIAFHDALQRPGFPELGVWRYLAHYLAPTARMIGTEVGIAWIVNGEIA